MKQRNLLTRWTAVAGMGLLLAGGAIVRAQETTTTAAKAPDPPVELDAQRKPSIVTNGNCFIKGGTILTVTHGTIQNGDILVKDGKIAAIGKNLTPPPGVTVIDATGKFITPGIIDAHSHIAEDATNEGADSITAEVRIHDVINPQSISLYHGLSSGVTSSLLLHGSANAIGGQSVVVKMKWNRPVEELIVPDAPRMIKFALGENPKQSNRFPGMTGPSRFPASRMGVEVVYRRAFEGAREYMRTWDRYEQEKQRNPNAVPPRRDLRLETVADILRGKIWVQSHSYRADEMLMLLRLSREYGFKLATLHHALEAYKITPEIAAQHVGVSTFASDWAYKIEANDAIPYNAALCLRAGIVTSVNSDSTSGSYHLNLEAAKCMKYGGLNETEALELVTINPAIQLGIDHRTGSLETGKDADIAIWAGHPLCNYSRCELTMVEGNVFFQRRDAFGVDKQAMVENMLMPDKIDALALPPLKMARSYAIVGGTVHPISGPDIPDGTVVIENGKIAAVGRNVAIPSGAVVVNAKGQHVYPGLIDAGSHLGLTEIGSIEATNDSAENGSFQPDLCTLMAVNPASEHIPVTRVAGITATQTCPAAGGRGFGAIFGGGGSIVPGQGAVIETAGWTPEQMKVSGECALHVNYPEGLSDDILERLQEFLSPDEIAQRTAGSGDGAKQIKDYFDQAKRYADLRASHPDQIAIDPRLEAMRPYMAGKAPVVFHVNSAKGIKGALKLAEDYHLKPIIAGGSEAWRVADVLAKQHVPVLYSVPLSNSMGSGFGRAYDPYDVAFVAPSLLVKAGVPLAFQSQDAADARNLPAQVGRCCAFGLSHDAALRAMTLGAAQILGVADQIGSLEPGKRADIIVTNGDPLEICANVHRMFIAGRPVDLESKHSRLYELYSQRLAEIPQTTRQHAYLAASANTTQAMR